MQLTKENVNWNRGKLISYIKFDTDSISEIYKQDFTYDSNSREIGVLTYAYGELVEKRSHFGYNVNQFSYFDSISNYKVFVENEYIGSLNDNKIKTKTIYNAAGFSIVSQENYIYDKYQREIGYSYTNTSKNVFEYENRDYTYNDNECIYFRDVFINKELLNTLKYVITFYDKTYNKYKILSEVRFEMNETEIFKNIYSYDSIGRENGYKQYTNGELVIEYKNYSYDNNDCTYYEYRIKDFPIKIYKRRIVYYKN